MHITFPTGHAYVRPARSKQCQTAPIKLLSALIKRKVPFSVEFAPVDALYQEYAETSNA